MSNNFHVSLTIYKKIEISTFQLPLRQKRITKYKTVRQQFKLHNEWQAP